MERRSQLHFTDSFPLLFIGDPTDYQIQISPWNMVVITGCPFVGVSDDGQMRVGIGCPCSSLHLSTSLKRPPDVVAAFHAARIIQELRTLNKDTIHQILHLAQRTSCCNSDEQERIIHEIGRENLSSIMAEPLPELTRLLSLFDEAGIPIDSEPLEREVLEGTIHYTVDLELRGVRPPSVILKRRERGRQLLEPHDPVINRLLKRLRYSLDLPSEIIESLRVDIRKKVLENIARGIDKPSFLVGEAYVSTVQAWLERIDALIFWSRGPSPETSIIIEEIIEHLGAEFPVAPSFLEWPIILLRAICNRALPRKILAKNSGNKCLLQIVQKKYELAKENQPTVDIGAEI